MVYEQRTYTVKPGLLQAYLKLFHEVGLPARRNFGQLIGFWFTEFGVLNQVVHIWAYASLDQRAAMRQALMRERQWAEDFLPKAMPMLDDMRSVVLNPAAFSPLQ